MKVLVADDLSAEGIAILQRGKGLTVDVKLGLKPADLKDIIGEYDALAVRSATKVTAEILEAGKKLKVVGRAGVGVDNVDLTSANRRGVVVMNTPGGNTITVAELTVAMMMGIARHLPQATASIKGGKWEKKRFEGHELFNKTLGVIGIGNIGSVVVDRCLGMKMKVVAYDPYITRDAAQRLGCELVSLDELYQRADYISVHVPLSDATRGLVGKEALARMKKGAFLVNCARGGIVDEAALYDALKSGHLGGAALDVFATEPANPENPLFKLDNFICTPHLGASTYEAQQNVATALAEQMVDYLCNGTICNAVNVPSVPREVMEKLGPWLALAQKLGALAAQLGPEAVSQVEVAVSGELKDQPLKAITIQALKGFLGALWGEPVNEVNAPVLAKERAIEVLELRRADHSNFASALSVRVRGKGEVFVEGTVFGHRDLRVTQVNHFDIEAEPEGTLLAMLNQDVPGVVGLVGQRLGEEKVNIARIHLARAKVGAEAFSLINVDSEPTPAVLDKLRATPGVLSVKLVHL